MLKNFTFDINKPCLVIAPHLEYPTRNGGDILIDRRWAEFSRYVPFVDIVGKRTVTRYRGGNLEDRKDFNNDWRPKRRAVARTVLGASHYLLEKYLTNGFRAASVERLFDPAYGTVVFSLISTASLYGSVPEVPGRLYCVETQNDEIKWFRDLRETSRNPVAKLAAYFSERWLRSFLKKHESTFLYLHVSGADREGYERLFPVHESIVAPVGVDMETGNAAPHKTFDKARLIFAGSLGVRMNLDALNIFGREFFPSLRAALKDGLEVVVAGSRPTEEVKTLCCNFGWKLFPDVTDEKLSELYSSSLFSMLPFHYVTGGKLKLLKSLSLGVPFLSTLEMRGQVDELVYPCLVSNDPSDWLKRVNEVKEKGIEADMRAALKAYAARHSWPVIVSDMLRALGRAPSPVTQKNTAVVK